MEEQRFRNRNEIGGTGAQLADNLRRWRNVRGVTTGQLSERLAELGRPILPSGITKIEKKGRQVSVDDLIALAVALEVDLAALLLPATVAEAAQITGAGTVPGYLARAWLEGAAPLVRPEDDADGRKLLNYVSTVRPPGWDSSRNVGLKLRQRLEAALGGSGLRGSDDG